MREKRPALAFIPLVSCLSPASIFLHQGSVRYRWSRTIPALLMPSSAQIICLPIGPYLSHHGCLSADEVDRFGGWECNCEMCGKETGVLCLREGIRLEANIRGGGKTVHVVFKNLSRSLLLKGERAE
jgi:hypothetical protein